MPDNSQPKSIRALMIGLAPRPGAATGEEPFAAHTRSRKRAHALGIHSQAFEVSRRINAYTEKPARIIPELQLQAAAAKISKEVALAKSHGATVVWCFGEATLKALRHATGREDLTYYEPMPIGEMTFYAFHHTSGANGTFDYKGTKVRLRAAFKSHAERLNAHVCEAA